MPTQKAVEAKAVEQKPITDKPSINLDNLKDDDKRILNIHLTPSFKNVLNKVFGQDIFPQYGISENTVSIPRSIIIERFGSMSNFRQIVQRDGNNNNVPPSQPTQAEGLMTSPQNMETV